MTPKRLAALYRRHFREPRRERMFLASLSFFVTFGAARWIAHAIRAGVGPFHDISAGEIHIHHLVWGILLLLAVGYLGLFELGAAKGPSVAPISRVIALVYGMGAALTLDEFALWLHLEDVYWERQGRASVDVVMLFGAFISAGLWGGPFLRGLSRETGKIFRRRAT